MNRDSIQAFVDARRLRPAWPSIPEALRPATIEDGYRLQHAIHDRIAAAGDQRVGWKVGATSAAGQRGFGLREPVYAGLFAANRSASLTEALALPLTRPSLECEIAVALRAGLDGSEPLHVMQDAVAACHIACEIIDNRYGDPALLGLPSLIADDFFQAGFVMGPENTGWRDQDLAAADGFIDIDGQRRIGSARDILSAFDSLRWLAQTLARNGQSLRAGEIVLTGTLVTPTPISLPARTVTLGITGFAPMTTA